MTKNYFPSCSQLLQLQVEVEYIVSDLDTTLYVTVPYPVKVKGNLTGYFDNHIAFSQTKKRVFIPKKQLFCSWDSLFACFKH